MCKLKVECGASLGGRKCKKKTRGHLQMQIFTTRILEEEPFDKIRTALYLHHRTSHHQNKDIEWHTSCNPHSEIT
jgi:hypothetical protein